MKLLVCAAALVGVAIWPAMAKSKHCTVRVHVEANAQDTPVFSSAVRARFSGKEIAIERMPRITEADVAAFQAYPIGQGNYGALLQLNEHGRFALDALSIEHRGGLLFVFINGRPVAELQIDRRVADGKIYIASGLTAADIELMKKDWPPGRKRR